MSGGIITLLILVVGIAVEVMRRGYLQTDSKAERRAELVRKLRLAVQEGRITDASTLLTALNRLGCLLVALYLSGCAHTAQPPILIGERILTPRAGDVLTVPPLVPPAVRWYLVDDVGLCGWLGIEPM